MTLKDNRIVVSLRSVQWARFYYENQYGQRIDTLQLPLDKQLHLREKRLKREDFFSVRNEWFTREETAFRGDGRTLYEIVKEQGKLDVWTPHVRLVITANRSLIYTGQKARSIYEAWQALQFSKIKKTK